MIELILDILKITCGVGLYHVLVGIFEATTEFMFGDIEREKHKI